MVNEKNDGRESGTLDLLLSNGRRKEGTLV